MMATQHKFWMVFAEGGDLLGRKYFRLADANAEAKRFALNNRKNAFVLEVVGVYISVSDVMYLDIDECAPEIAHG